MRAGWCAGVILALVWLPNSLAGGSEQSPALSTPVAALAKASQAGSYMFSEWEQGPGPDAGVVVIDPLVAARIAHLQGISPAFRRSWEELENSGIPLIIGSSEQLEAVTPRHIHESPDWAGVTLTWRDDVTGGLHRAAVAVRIQLLRDLHDYYGNPQRAYIEALDEVLVREIYGNLVPVVGGDIRPSGEMVGRPQAD